MLVNNQGDAKSQWKTINVLGRSNAAQSSINKSLHDDIPNAFNEHFLNIPSVPDSDTSDNNCYRRYLSDSPNFSFFLSPVNVNEIEAYIKALKTSSPGYDELPPKLLSLCAKIISIPFTHIMNLIFRTGIFPENIKIAKIIPIFKSGDASNICNYRPISILPALGKVIEKAVAKRLITFLENNNLLSDNQHGFRQKHSTETALLEFVSSVYKHLDEKSYCVG